MKKEKEKCCACGKALESTYIQIDDKKYCSTECSKQSVPDCDEEETEK